MLTFNEIPRTKEMHKGARIEPTNALAAYRPYAQPVTLVSREKEAKGARARTEIAAPPHDAGWAMHKKGASDGSSCS